MYNDESCVETCQQTIVGLNSTDPKVVVVSRSSKPKKSLHMSIENIRAIVFSDVARSQQAKQTQSQQLGSQQHSPNQQRETQQSQPLDDQQLQGLQHLQSPQQMQSQQLESEPMPTEQQMQSRETQEQRQLLRTQQAQLQSQCHQYIHQVSTAVDPNTGVAGPSITPRTSTECYCYLDVMLHCCPNGDLGSSITTPTTPADIRLISGAGPQMVAGAQVPDTCNLNLRSCCPKIDTVLDQCCGLEWPNGKWVGNSAVAQAPAALKPPALEPPALEHDRFEKELAQRLVPASHGHWSSQLQTMEPQHSRG